MNTAASTATVIGREHLRLNRNNQDGACVLFNGQSAVAVVTDGCSSQPFSEVGARLGAHALATLTLQLEHVTLEAVPALASEHLVTWLTRLVSLSAPDADRRVLEQFGLFTFLCAVQRGPDCVVFGMGDGAVWVDGRLQRLTSGPDNAPAYVGYRVLGRDLSPAVHHLGPATRVALLTDGLEAWAATEATAFAAVLDEPHVWKNPVHLQRRLNVVNEVARFTDDATLAVLDTRDR
jgi:hypothetical protein